MVVLVWGLKEEGYWSFQHCVGAVRIMLVHSLLYRSCQDSICPVNSALVLSETHQESSSVYSDLRQSNINSLSTLSPVIHPILARKLCDHFDYFRRSWLALDLVTRCFERVLNYGFSVDISCAIEPTLLGLRNYS